MANAQFGFFKGRRGIAAAVSDVRLFHLPGKSEASVPGRRKYNNTYHY